MPDKSAPAAQYLRMSTEHQQYSFDNQSDAIRRYAKEHGFEVVRSYEDAAKSGLQLRNRPGLQALLQHVVARTTNYKAILVLDVTRWGRFQDIDESAHYEFLCKQAGIPVHYCSEPFTNSSTLVNMILKSLKRSMAAEYSRELSAKVSAGQRRIAALGFKLGGNPGYGLRRLLLNSDGTPKQILKPGERKSLSMERVVLTPGPEEEVSCVREIYRLFIDERLSSPRIVEELNQRAIPFVNGGPWYQQSVYRVLTDPKYCGTHVWGRRSRILNGPSVAMPRETWSVVPKAFEPIVSHERFEEAQRIIHLKTFFQDNEKVLDSLRSLWATKGKLSEKLINEAIDVPSTRTFWSRFGGLRNAYRLIGYTGVQSSLAITDTRKRLAAFKEETMAEIVDRFPGEVCIAGSNWRNRLRLKLKDNSLMTVYLCRSHFIGSGLLRWYLDTVRNEYCKYCLVLRMDGKNQQIFDYCLLPCIRRATRLTLRLDDPRLSVGVRFTEPSQFLCSLRIIERKRSLSVSSARLYKPLRKAAAGSPIAAQY